MLRKWTKFSCTHSRVNKTLKDAPKETTLKKKLSKNTNCKAWLNFTITVTNKVLLKINCDHNHRFNAQALSFNYPLPESEVHERYATSFSRGKGPAEAWHAYQVGYVLIYYSTKYATTTT